MVRRVLTAKALKLVKGGGVVTVDVGCKDGPLVVGGTFVWNKNWRVELGATRLKAEVEMRTCDGPFNGMGLCNNARVLGRHKHNLAKVQWILVDKGL